MLQKMAFELEMKKRKLLMKDFLNGLNCQQAATRVEEKFGSKGFRIRTVQRWYNKFRAGDFSLDIRPDCGKKPKNGPTKKDSAAKKPASKKSKSKRAPQKQVKVESVTFKQEQRRSQTLSRIRNSPARSLAVQKLMEQKPGITVSKVSSRTGTKVNSIPPTLKPILKKTISVNETNKQKSAPPPPTMPKLRPIHDLTLPPNIANRMTSPPTLTESHSITEGRSSAQKPVKKSITVQFQNVSPEIVKNTVRKAPEASAVPLHANKRVSLTQATPLSSPKGIIYLNPQEIFRQNFGSPTSPGANGSKTVGSIPKPPLPISQPATTSQAVEISDSESENDLVFPENVTLPPPKIKAVADTFTTYWDMETDQPILLNPAEETVPNTPDVIEID